jgi:hypothetical protein
VKGPLVVGWRSLRTLGEIQAGTSFSVQIELENRGSAVWRPGRVRLAYHWLDEHANPIVWDGRRTEGPSSGGLSCRERQSRSRHEFGLLPLRALPPCLRSRRRGPMLVCRAGQQPTRDAGRGRPTRCELCDSAPRARAPCARLAERVSAAHEQGYAAVGGSLSLITKPFRRGRRLRAFEKELEQYRPGGGRDPAFAAPLICPSLLAPLMPNTIVAGFLPGDR